MFEARQTFVLSAVIALFAVASCGTGEEGDGNGSTNIFSPNNQGTDGGSDGSTGDDSGTSGNNSAQNNLLEGCEDVECETDFRCVRGACVPDSAPVACEQPIDLGELDPASATLTASGDTTDFIDSTTTECGSIGPFSGAENAFSFSVTSAATLNLELTTDAAVNWAMEVRRNACQDRSARVICSDPETTSFAVEPGVTYYLIVEPADSINKGAFEVNGTFSAGACAPAGSLRCVDETDVAFCFAGEEERVYSCPAGCSNDRCEGESCAGAIDITESTTLTGNIEGFANDFDFDAEPTCSVDGTDGIAAPGGDFVLRFPNLTSGQTVILDGSSDSVDQVFYVVDSCSATAECTAAADLGDRLQFTAERDGEHFVIVDVSNGRRGDFEVEVTIQ